MLAEVLLVLGGYPSSLITPDGVAPALAEHLHPGEVAALTTLGRLAGDYRRVRDWSNATQGAARAAVLKTPEGGKEPGQYVAVLAGAVRGVLDEYTDLLVETEARILANDNSIVQPFDSGAYVPLSLLLATFDEWHAPLVSLAALVHSLPPTPGELLTHLTTLSSSGDPSLRRIYTTLLSAVWQLFLSHLCLFLLDGLAPDTSSPSVPALGLDAGADPPHRLYKLNLELLPICVGASARESMLYVGRVAATLKREGRALPRAVTEPARQRVMTVEPEGLDMALQRVRADVGEWLWTHILTGQQVADAIESFANYFLTREADFALNVIREIGRLRHDRLVTANPTSSSSVIRPHDLDLALLRASVGTDVERDKGLEALHWAMPLGPLKPSSLLTPAKSDDVRSLFAPALLGAPIHLTATVSWPLNLFMTPPALAAYGEIHAYLLALRDTHLRVLDVWTALGHAQRRRRVYTGTHEGGADAREQARRSALARAGWGLVRGMLFVLDQLLSHFMVDIVGAQHRRLLESLGDGGAPGRGAQYLDFLTLRQMHARHLAFLREGLLIADRESAVLVRDLLDTCKRFCGLVERWGGDVLPELLSDEEGDVVGERAKAVDEVNETLLDLVTDLFRLLLESQAPPVVDTSMSGSASGTGSVSTRASISRASLSRRVGPMSKSRVDDGEAAGRHVEQLLLRLDFNGVLTAWQEGRVGSVLAGLD
ncbi:hypothetical protein CC85DRAFT_264533 [Cutaneotrichosporon oleaginosum]|uniref:Spindle pole body component n=1 Tax=Cutaneotrichosporon oleaginosum TaxID=879819 RepID=A0A0J1AXF3_9TREE|nr:uncharacterized protein CC85DRAFT_264533 [Cutaneotrichosporon oleaginosum]KLT39994.1 hypothetical protein CC85DRAFT_264533 [Cutaneotrichosporon oleaginosum]TXT14183.1 hypothetical protein COLE_00376 [Cutaneotrichosporon oleaginosum]